MRGARALIFPGLEDFGMTPVEVMACGRPVIAYGKGGALETIVDGVTGVFASEQTVESFIDALYRFESATFHSDQITQQAQKFSFSNFAKAMHEAVAEVTESPVASPSIRLTTHS